MTEGTCFSPDAQATPQTNSGWAPGLSRCFESTSGDLQGAVQPAEPRSPHPAPSMHSELTSGLQVLFCMWLPIDFFWGTSGEGCGEQGQDSGHSNWMENPAGEVVPSAKAEVAGPDPLRSRSVLGFWARVRISPEALVPQRLKVSNMCFPPD